MMNQKLIRYMKLFATFRKREEKLLEMSVIIADLQHFLLPPSDRGRPAL